MYRAGFFYIEAAQFSWPKRSPGGERNRKCVIRMSGEYLPFTYG